MAKTGPVSFLEVATKRGVTDMTQQMAKSIGSMATQLGKQKAKQDAADKAELKQMMAGVTRPSKLNKLLVQDAQKSFGETTMGLQKLYNSNDPQRSIKGQMLTNDYLEKVKGEYVARSVNYDILEEESRKTNLWRPKRAQKLVDQYTLANNEQQFLKFQEEDPTPEYFNPATLQLNLPAAKERIDTQKVFDGTIGEIKEMQVSDKLTLVPLLEKDANEVERLYKVRPNTIEQVIDASFMNNYDYLEQYVDNRDLPVQDVRSMTPEERAMVKTSLLEDGSKFRERRLKENKNTYINVNTGALQDSTFNFTPNLALPKVTVAEGGKNVVKYAPSLGNIKPQGSQKFPINNYKGAVNRQGQPYSGAKKSEAELSTISIRPYKIVNGEDNVIIDYKDIQNAVGFKVYYEFNGGDISIPASSEPNLQFNVGGKDAVATQRNALQKQKQFQIKVNEYHKKVKAGTIKNPLLYQKMKDVAENRLTDDEYIEFVQTFKFDK
jgi:hypothetical protein